MNKQQAEEKLIDYLNGALSETEIKQFEKALREYPELQEELTELTELLADLPYSSEPVSPEAGMKERVLEKVFQTEPAAAVDQPIIRRKKKRTWLLPSLVAVLLLSLVGNIFFYQAAQDKKTGPQVANREQVKTSKELQTAKKSQGNAVATIIQAKNSDKLIIEAKNLKPLTANKRYQVWLLKDGKPKRAGTFNANKDGSGGAVHTIAKKAAYDTVAITIEPDENSQTPKGPIILSSKL